MRDEAGVARLSKLRSKEDYFLTILQPGAVCPFSETDPVPILL
jgi:hypothetical protein